MSSDCEKPSHTYSRRLRAEANGGSSGSVNADGGRRELLKLLTAEEIALILAVDPSWRLPSYAGSQAGTSGARMLAAHRLMVMQIGRERDSSHSRAELMAG